MTELEATTTASTNIEQPPGPVNEAFMTEESVTGATTTTPAIVEEEEEHSASETAQPEVFVNHGFRRWELAREAWLKDNLVAPSESRKNNAAVALDVDEIIDLIFSQRWRTPNQKSHFPQPVPLPQMVDILVDLWEAEGLDI